MILNSSRRAVSVFEKCLSKEVEEVWIAALNSNLRLIEKKLLFRGTVNQCTLYPRDIIRFVCGENASSFILCHNHPSGNPKPSTQDIQITKNIYQISQLIEIPLSDHIILSDSQYYSFADQGYLVRWSQLKKPRRY